MAPLVAILFAPVLSLIGFALDSGYVSTTSHQQQEASDAAAIADASYVAVSCAGNRRSLPASLDGLRRS